MKQLELMACSSWYIWLSFMSQSKTYIHFVTSAEISSALSHCSEVWSYIFDCHLRVIRKHILLLSHQLRLPLLFLVALKYDLLDWACYGRSDMLPPLLLLLFSVLSDIPEVWPCMYKYAWCEFATWVCFCDVLVPPVPQITGSLDILLVSLDCFRVYGKLKIAFLTCMEGRASFFYSEACCGGFSQQLCKHDLSSCAWQWLPLSVTLSYLFLWPCWDQVCRFN